MNMIWAEIELANSLQVCRDSGAKKVMLPITSATDLTTVPADKAKQIVKEVADLLALFDRIVNPKRLVRRMTLVANHLIPENESKKPEPYQQMDLFTDYAALEAEKKKEEALTRERRMQEAVLSLKKKFGNNAVLKGMNLSASAWQPT